MVKWKGKLPEGKHFHEPISLMDFFVTSAEISGTPLPADREYDGVNLLPFITGEKGGVPHKVMYWRSGYNKAIRKGEWKLIMNERDGSTILYNLKDDKVERKDGEFKLQVHHLMFSRRHHVVTGSPGIFLVYD